MIFRVLFSLFLLSSFITNVYAASCLDVFAGSGALGLEALSRGAKSVVLLERNPKAHQAISQHLQNLPCEANAQVLHCDALKYLAQPAEQSFDIIFSTGGN